MNTRFCARFLLCCAIGWTSSAALANDEVPGSLTDHLNIVFSASSADGVHRFYGEALGLDRLTDIMLPGQRQMIRYQGGASELKFIVPNEQLPTMSGAVGDARGIRLLALVLPLGQQDGIMQRLDEHGFVIPEMTTRRTEEGVFQYSFGMSYDSDGNQIEIVFLEDNLPASVFQQAQFGLSVSDMSAMDAFLTQVLNYKPVATEGRIHRYEMGASQIKFWQVPAEQPSWTGPPAELTGMSLVQAIVPDVPAVRESIIARGGKIHTEPFDLGGMATIMFVEAPDGILFEFAGPPLESAND